MYSSTSTSTIPGHGRVQHSALLEDNGDAKFEIIFNKDTADESVSAISVPKALLYAFFSDVQKVRRLYEGRGSIEDDEDEDEDGDDENDLDI